MEFYVRLFLGFCAVLFALYKYGTSTYSYWKKRGVKQLNPAPFIGDNHFGVFKNQDGLQRPIFYYSSFKAGRFGGLYFNRTPFLTIADPELLKQIMIKDADHFGNRYSWFKNDNPLLAKSLFNLKDETWKSMRNVMTTVFTSAKMKDMFQFMDKCAKQGVDFLEEQVAEELKCGRSGKSFFETDCKEFFSRYGTDVISSTAFGLEVDSFKDPNNEFYSSGIFIRNLTNGSNALRLGFTFTFPTLARKLNVQLLDPKYTKFFTSLIEETIRHRVKNNIVRKDVIHILMEARKGKGVNEEGELIKGKLPDLTDVEIAAQGLVFFFGGFETVATLLGFVSYELALNPDIQEKLQQEIDEVIEKNNGITYDGVMHEMEYLNMVFNETLRKWPTAISTDREVTKPYVIPKTDVSPEVVLKKGDGVWIPIAAFHYDPEFFPDPERFDPERFRDEKNTIKPFTYLPFGGGPRHCIGMRYALMEGKTLMVHLLRRFTLVPSQKTVIPIRLSPKSPLVLTPKDGFFLGLQPRRTAI